MLSSDVQTLVNFLNEVNGSAFVGVAEDGFISISSRFSPTTSFYAEIEIQGFTSAVITYKSRWAKDLPVEKVSDLTPDLIMEAVDTIAEEYENGTN